MRFLRPVITIAGLFLIWGLIAYLFDLPRFILPSPLLVLSTLVEKSALISDHALITLSEIVLGLAFGISIGMLSALSISAYQPARQWVLPIVIASQAIPVFAIAPILVLWMGYGIGPKVIVGALIIYFPVTIGFLDGLNRTGEAWTNMASLLQQRGQGGKIRNIFYLYRYVKVPFALPALASGIRIAAAVAPIGAIVGEWVGASSGLGFLMLNANARVQTDLMFACLLVLIFMAVSLYYLVDYGLRRALPWQPDRKSLIQ